MSEVSDSASIRIEDDLRLATDEPMIEISSGLFGLRRPLPFALDHVNIWLLRDGGGWTLIDTGIANDPTRAFWANQLENHLHDRPLERLIATHFHPDHMGLAGWICEQVGATVWSTRTEWLTAQALAHNTSNAFVEAGRRFDTQAGLDAERIAERARRGNLYRTRAEAPPASYTRVEEATIS